MKMLIIMLFKQYYSMNCNKYLLNADVSLMFRRCPPASIFGVVGCNGEVGVEISVFEPPDDDNCDNAFCSVKLSENVASKTFSLTQVFVGVFKSFAFGFTAYGETGVEVCEILLDLSVTS